MSFSASLLPSVFPSIMFFSNELILCIRWPNYWSFSFTISPSSEYSGFISFRTDWFDLLAFQGSLKSLLQHHSSKDSILQRSALVQLSHPYMTTGKTIALTLWIFVSKAMSLLFNTPSRFVIAFLPKLLYLEKIHQGRFWCMLTLHGQLEQKDPRKCCGTTAGWG